MNLDEYLTYLRNDGEAFAQACAKNMSAQVPSCPDWTVTKLMNHMGRVHRWAAIAAGDENGATPDGFPPAPKEITPEWYLSELNFLIDVLNNTDPKAPRWNFSPNDQNAGFWFRRQTLEVAVHRWDAQLATSTPQPIGAALAVDGINEILDIWIPGVLASNSEFNLGGTLHLHATDEPGEWLISIVDSTIEVERSHAKGSLALQGTASDLYLWLWRRVPEDRLNVFGDTTIAKTWKSLPWA